MGKESHATCPEKQLFNIETAQCEDFQLVFCGLRPVNHADKNQCNFSLNRNTYLSNLKIYFIRCFQKRWYLSRY